MIGDGLPLAAYCISQVYANTFTYIIKQVSLKVYHKSWR